MVSPRWMLDRTAAVNAKDGTARATAARRAPWALPVAIDLVVWAVIVWQIVRAIG
jgi:hypothetical protein